MIKKLGLIASVGSLLFGAACSSNSGGVNGPSPQPTGNFSNASVRGPYAYQIRGCYYTSTSCVPYAEEGSFTADGNGNISAISDDFVQSGTTYGGGLTGGSGTYSVNSDGTGTVTLNNVGLTTVNLAISVVGANKIYLTEQDSANAYGVAELQNTANLATTPNGNLVFKLHDAGLSSRVGLMAVSNGAVAGYEDVLAGGVLDGGLSSPYTLTGTINAPSNGRGTGSYNDGVATISFVYYVVTANEIRLLRTDSGIVSVGRAEGQSGTFTNASFAGNYIFRSRADDGSGQNTQNTVGLITADGNGGVSGGSLDYVADGNAVAGASISAGGTYSVGVNGDIVLTYTTSAGLTVSQIWWMVSPTRAFYLTNSGTMYEDGIADQQQAGTYSNASLTGPYAFFMDGFISNSALVDRIGWLSGDGNGNLSWYENVNSGGTYNNTVGLLSGSYVVGPNGRGTATVTSVSQTNNDLVFYMVSPNQAYIIQDFSGYELIGGFDIQ